MKSSMLLLILIGAFIPWVAPPASGQVPPQPPSADALQAGWQVQAKLLGEQAIRQLARDKLLITNRTHQQIFSPYLSPDLPLFITSDSLLNAFHVLYEESLKMAERAHARQLPEVLRLIRTRLSRPGPSRAHGEHDPLVVRAQVRAELVLGVALRLLGEQPALPPGDLNDLISTEVGRVMAATETLQPSWLDPTPAGTPTLDYTRCRPRGLYTESAELAAYFRTVAWLRQVPFRVTVPEELQAILLLGRAAAALQSDEASHRMLRQTLRGFEDYIGPLAGPDLLDAARIAKEYRTVATGFGHLPEPLLKLPKNSSGAPTAGAGSHDRSAAPPAQGEQSLTLVSAYETPDNRLFQRTTDPQQFRRTLPSGLEVCAALGSSFARSALPLSERDRLLAVIDEARTDFAGPSLYSMYLEALSPLLGQPEPDSPPFLSQPPWQIKSCQTVLGGWAQLRHGWTLHAHKSLLLTWDDEQPAGFVEPVPEFFTRMARLVRRTEEKLREAQAFEQVDLRPAEPSSLSWPYSEEVDLRPLWHELGVICHRLEELAHKQLRRTPFTAKDEQFIREYGIALARIMLYSANSYYSPRDDAPRVAEVFRHRADGRYLEVGVARAQELYVLYPFGEREILCRGAVMPYHEFLSTKRLTDEEWRALLDSPNRPATPSWVSPILLPEPGVGAENTSTPGPPK